MTAKTKQKIKTRLLIAGRIAILALFLLGVILPIYWLFITSLKRPPDINTLQIQYWPQNPTAENYARVWNNTPFPRYVKNSLIVSVVSAFIVLLIAVPGGYALARYAFRLKKASMTAFLISQMIPVTLLLIPLFLMLNSVRLGDTLTSLIVLYVVFNTPFCVMTMQGFFMNIPSSIEEAAAIDGCNKFQMMVRIVLPVMLPAIISVFIFAFIGAWNEFLGGVMFINSELNKTIPVGLSAYVGQFAINWGEMTAGGMLAIIPTVILFAFAQRYIVAGLTAGAEKG